MTCSLSPNNYISTENLIQNFQGVGVASSIPLNTSVTSYRVNDILFSNIRPYLKKSWKADMNGGCSTDVFVFRHNIDCLPDFLYYLIANDDFVNYVMTGAKGVKMPRGDKQQIAQYPVYLPTKPEQSKITSLLSLIDERISTQNKIIEKLESSIKGLNNHLHETYGEEVEICLANIGITYSGLSGKTSEDFGSGKSYITYLNVYQNDILDTSLTGNVNIMDGELQNKVAYGDVLFTLSSETPHEVGVSAVCLCELHDTYLNSFCFGYRLHNRDVLIPEYMPYCFSSSKFRKFILPFAQGSTRYNLQKTDFMNASFSVPKLSKQKHIANLLYAISQKIWTEKRMLLVCQKQKEYFLKNMFI